MATYIVSYDLRKEKNYEKLYDAIKSYWTYAKILESLWAIKSNQTKSEIRNYLSSFMDNDDWLFVLKSGKEWAWKNVNCSNEWLKTNL